MRIDKEKKYDFVYIASVSRATTEDYENAALGKGRANNLLGSMFDMLLKEEEELQRAAAEGKERGKREEMKQTLAGTVRPVLLGHVTKNELLDRMNPRRTCSAHVWQPPSDGGHSIHLRETEHSV